MGPCIHDEGFQQHTVIKSISMEFFKFSVKRFSLRMVNRYGISLIPLVKLCPADMYSYAFSKTMSASHTSRDLLTNYDKSEPPPGGMPL